MLCDWLDPVFVRYVLLIVVVCTVILVCTVVHFLAVLDKNAAATNRRCLGSIYITTMFVCIWALILLSNAMIQQLHVQTHRVDRVLSAESFKSNRPLWDSIQRGYECCGRNNATDWSYSLPESCCPESAAPFRFAVSSISRPGRPDEEIMFITNECMQENAHRRGCVKALTGYLKTVCKYTSIASFAFMCFALMGSLLSCAMEYGCSRAAKVRQEQAGEANRTEMYI